MSLRARILLLFLGFSVLPVVLLGAGDYYQSVEALRAVLDARSDALAEQAAREVEAAHARAEGALKEHLHSGGPGITSPNLFTYVARVNENRRASERVRCVDQATVPVRAHTRGGTIEAGLPIDTLLAWTPGLRTPMGEYGFVQLLDRRTGTPLFDSRCMSKNHGGGALPAAAGPVLRVARGLPVDRQGHASVRYGSGQEQFVAAVSGAGPAWAVAVNVSASEFIRPFQRARMYYLGLAILVLTLAAVAFLLLVQGAFGSLRLITTAAEQIELGNLRPWLPPPGQDEVGRLSLAFRRMTERLDDSIRQAELNQKLAAVGELATYLSHEIRNPLSSIRLSLQSLHRDVKAGFIPADSPRVIEIALGEVKRLDGVVRAVLEMGRPATETEVTTCSVHETLDETLDVLRPKLRAEGIELTYAPNAAADLVHGDASGLRSVVINLVVNAMDALAGRPDPRIRIGTWSGGEGELHIRIADNGPGVPLELVHSIFEPFFTTKARGNGIGLPTALRTLQGWGGTISHESAAAGSGAVFLIKLKLAGPANAEVTTEENLITAQAS